MICPDCGTSQPDGAGFCTVCGGDLTAKRFSRRAWILVCVTPLFLLLAGIAFSYDLGSGDPVESGTGFGLFLSLVYIVAASVYRLVGKACGKANTEIGSWLAGMFGVLEFFAAFALSYPLFELAGADRLRRLPIDAEEQFQLGLMFAVFFPALLAGLAALSTKETAVAEKHGPTPFGRFGTVGALGLTVALFATALQLFPAFHKDYLLARLYADLGQGQRALRLLNTSIEKRPDFAPALYLKGVMRLARSMRGAAASEATDLLWQAVVSDPKNPRYLLALSMAQEQFGRLEEAVITASQAIGLNPDDPALWARQGDLLLTASRPEEAVEVYRKSLQLKPNDPRTLNNLAFTLSELGRDLTVAVDLARESVAKQAGYVYNSDTLAWALYKSGNANEAYGLMRDVRGGGLTGVQTPEIEFHYLTIANELGLVEKPYIAFSKLLADPKIREFPSLEQHICATLASLTRIISAEEPIQPAGASESEQLLLEQTSDSSSTETISFPRLSSETASVASFSSISSPFSSSAAAFAPPVSASTTASSSGTAASGSGLVPTGPDVATSP
ncbi:MAG: tetratricopeptide repeat protein [Candidatus Ozemobacteraceae bacterium]